MKRIVFVLCLLYISCNNSPVQGPGDIIGTEKNVALDATVTVSAGSNNGPYLVDGDISTAWNSGRPAPQWAEIDLGFEYNISRIELVINQTPDGNTIHNIWMGKTPADYELITTIKKLTKANETINIQYTNEIKEVRCIKIETESSPSWVGWFEARAFINTF